MSNLKDKPVFDEQTLDRLLEAAYVLQEHNNRARELSLELHSDQLREEEGKSTTQAASATSPAEPQAIDDYTQILAQIVETQHQIQVRQLELEQSLELLAERLTKITGAAGAAIGIVDGKTIIYRAGSGTSALPAGTRLPMEKGLCFTALRTGQVMRCADVNPEFLLDAEECHRRGIQSLIAVPVYHEGGVAGAMELHFGKIDGFTDQDVHTCQLMAGLVTEALARDAQLTWKQSLSSERATILEALERLKPNLSALSADPIANDAGPKQSPALTSACGNCGHALAEQEQFCGKCGSPRAPDHDPSTLQSKVATMLQMRQSKDGASAAANHFGYVASAPGEHTAGTHDAAVDNPADEDTERELARLLANSVPDFSILQSPAEKASELPQGSGPAANSPADAGIEDSGAFPETPRRESQNGTRNDEALATRTNDVTWNSAANARDFLERVAPQASRTAFERFWKERRGDVYLAIAVILAGVVLRWGIWSNHPVGANSSGTPAPAVHKRADADLSLFDRMLISLGLAQAPDKPEPKGNPDTQVWVDLHTALYYCPGTDLYGKTPKGKYTSQKDAQLDQFEPAYRKACD